MRQGDMLSPVPQRVANPKNSKRPNSAGLPIELGKDAPCHLRGRQHKSMVWLLSTCQSVRKTGPCVDLYNVSTYQCSILFNNMGSFNRKSEFRKAENMSKPVSPNEKFNVTNDLQLAEADSLPTDEKELLDDWLSGMSFKQNNDQSIHARIDSSGYVRLSWESDNDRNDMRQSLRTPLARRPESRARSAE